MFFFHSLEYCSLKHCVGVLGLIKRPSIRAQMCTELCSPRPLCYVLLWVIEFSSKVTAQDIVTLISNHFVATVFFLLQWKSTLKLIAFAIFLNTFLQYWDKLKVFDYITMIWILWWPFSWFFCVCAFAEVPWRSWAWFPDWHGAGDSLTHLQHIWFYQLFALLPDRLFCQPHVVHAPPLVFIFFFSLSCVVFFFFFFGKKTTFAQPSSFSVWENLISGFAFALTFSRHFCPKWQQ